MVEFDLTTMEKNQIPDVSTQKSKILETLKEPMEVGQTWMLIETKWFKTFKSFVGLEEYQERYMTINPGPIDNSLLLEENSTNQLKKGLVEILDYVPIPTSAWELLLSWYGLREHQEPIERKVINIAEPPKVECMLEVYLVELNLYNNLEFENPVTHAFSAVDTISKVEEVCKKKFNIADGQQTVLKCYYAPKQSQVLRNKSSTIYEESLNKNFKICLLSEHHRSFIKPFPKNNLSKIPRVVPTTRSVTSPVPGVSRQSSSSMGYSTLGTAEGRGPPCTPGLTGLMNLGNTCFLNSVIQCLSNCEPIMKYFLERNHESEINTTNPLGKSGLIATSFADLVSMMWSGLHSTTVPHCFKMQLTKFAPQFAGYQQHDAQELLTFLLDGLHEDLNRVKEKPYCQDDENDQEDDVLARTSWENFLRRNDSIIIDHFHGMLKSRVVCPDCEKVSIKFDTFSTLSLPIPMRCVRSMKICYVPFDQEVEVVEFMVDVPKKGTIHDLILELSKETRLETNQIIIAEVYRCHFHKFYSQDDPLEDIDTRDQIYMYDAPTHLVNNPQMKFTTLPVVFWEVRDCNSNSSFLSSLFGTPFLMFLPSGPILFQEFYKLICERMTRACAGLWKAWEKGCKSDDIEGSHSSQLVGTYLFTPVLVNMFQYEEVHKIEPSEDGTFMIPEHFGQEVLALQMERRVRKQFYHEHLPIVKDYSDLTKHMAKPTLDDCLNLFTTTEKLGENNAWHCPRCNEKKRATKKLDLWKLPNILIFHLKRFTFNEIRKEKLEIKVEFPLTELNIDKFVVANKHKENLVYDLIGVCNHYGSLASGHYSAFCKSSINGNWYCFDDSTVNLISPEAVQADCAYLLFYCRRPKTLCNPNGEKVDV